jgi:hypothetical protein
MMKVPKGFLNNRSTTLQERQDAIEAAQNRLTWTEEQMLKRTKKEAAGGGTRPKPRPAEISAQEWHDMQVDHRALIVNSTAADEKQKALENTIAFTSMQVEKQMIEKASCTLIFRGWRSENEDQRTKFVEEFLRGHLGFEGRDIKDINHRHPLSGHMSKATHVQMRSSNTRTSVFKHKHKYQHLLWYTDDEQQGAIKVYGADSIYTMQRKNL